MSENEGGRLNFALGFQEVLNTTFSLLFKNMFKFFIIIFIVGIPSLLISNFLPGEQEECAKFLLMNKSKNFKETQVIKVYITSF